LKHVEIENSKLKDTQRKLRSELVSCEKTVVSLKKQLEDFQKLREETISLKTLLEEARRIAEVNKVQMIKKEEDEWYIDNGCSSHITRDQDKFIILKRKDRNVAFGDDSSAKILGEGVVELGRKNVKAKNVLLVEDLNHNLLSVSKMCDQGYTLTFDSRKCKIRENNSGRLVATTTRRPNNIYILDMKNIEKKIHTKGFQGIKSPKDQK
jgi:hypothetical protein